MLIALLLLGFFAGLLGALTGIGGGVLLTPIEPCGRDHHFGSEFFRTSSTAHH
jgi:hypothetical protein